MHYRSWLGLVGLLLPLTATAHSCIQTQFAPLPKGAIGPAVSKTKGYRVQSFGGGAYMITDGVYQMMFLVACQSVIVVDAPPTIGHNILAAIRTITPLPISHVVYSHAHADHIGAAYLYGNSADHTILAHHDTAQELALAASGESSGARRNRPAPTVTFSTSYNLTVCNQTLELAYPGPNHQPGNILIYAPAQKVVMMVDIVFPGWVPFSQLGEAQSVPGFIAAHDLILSYDFDHYIGGHLDRSGVRKDVETQRAYVTDLFNNCVEAIVLSALPPNATNPVSVQKFFPPIEKKNPGNSWALFKVYLEKTQAYCIKKTNEKWLGRLGGADVFGLDNAYTMIESLRIDYDVLGPFEVMSSK